VADRSRRSSATASRELVIASRRIGRRLAIGSRKDPGRNFYGADGASVDSRRNGAILCPKYIASLFVPTIGLRPHQ
jgi:hypothetical protein